MLAMSGLIKWPAGERPHRFSFPYRYTISWYPVNTLFTMFTQEFALSKDNQNTNTTKEEIQLTNTTKDEIQNTRANSTLYYSRLFYLFNLLTSK